MKTLFKAECSSDQFLNVIAMGAHPSTEITIMTAKFDLKKLFLGGFVCVLLACICASMVVCPCYASY